MVALSGILATTATAAIDEDRVLVVANADSAVSLQVVRIYRQYHPGIPDQNVVYLSGLGDVQSPADEIISRTDFETLIAEPIRQHLVLQELVDQVWVIVTTAGTPYRIADTNLPGVVYAAGSNPLAVANNRHLVDAASVESDLAMLFQIDPALDSPQKAPLAAKVVNPYHGYISPFEEFAADRDVLGRRGMFNFEAPSGSSDTVYDGTEWSLSRATGGRIFCAGDIYLVARLDGPKAANALPLAAIRRMLESAARVSDPTSANFHGYDPDYSVAALDDSDAVSFSDQWLNAGSTLSWLTPPQEYLQAAEYPTPPSATSDGLYREDFRFAYRSLAGLPGLPSGNGTEVLLSPMHAGSVGGQVAFDPTGLVLCQTDLPQDMGMIGLATFGTNAADGRTKDYLLTGGPDNGRLVDPAYGAVFNSLESFNALTFFADATTSQAKLTDWLTIGGSAAVGHAFEPLSSSAVDNDLMFYNYLRDQDGDGCGDLTFVEAAYTAMPFLSWANVVVGDPLMRVSVSYSGTPGIGPPVINGDANWDGYVSSYDYLLLAMSYGSQLGDDNYDERADFNQDGWVSSYDYLLLAMNYGYSWQPPWTQSGSPAAATTSDDNGTEEDAVKSGKRPRKGRGQEYRGVER